MDNIREKCMTLTGIEGLSAKYIANSAICLYDQADTAFTFCITSKNPSTTSTTTTTITTTTATASSSTTTSTLISETKDYLNWRTIPGTNLPKMPCIPTLLTSTSNDKNNQITSRTRRGSGDESKTEGNLARQ
jgi:hypothetical protein